MNSVKWELTQKCNLKCKHCFVGKIKYEKDMSISEAKKMLDIIKKSGVNEIVLSTKEPLAYDNICELLDYCSELDFYITIVTNGTLVTDKFINSLSKCKIKTFSVSLEGISPETNDYVRGEGVYKKVVDAINNINSLNYSTKNFFPLALQISLTSKNYCEVDKMIEWFQKSPFIAVNVGDISILGNAEDNRDLKLTEEQYEKASNRLLEDYQKLEEPSFTLNLKKSTPYDTLYYNMRYGLSMECVVPSCAAYHGYYSLLPNGDTCSCVALMDDVFASHTYLRSDYNLIRDKKFESVTRIENLGQYRENGFCSECRFKDKCELCLLIVYDKDRFYESTMKCYSANIKLRNVLDDIFLGKQRFKISPHSFIYVKDEKTYLKKVNQTGTINEIVISDKRDLVIKIYSENKYVSIKDLSYDTSDEIKSFIEELMYNDMIQIE